MRREPTPSEQSLLDTILEASYELSNTLGCGFLEKIYQRGLARELSIRGIETHPEFSCPVFYKDTLLGNYYADLLVASSVIVETKCVDRITNTHIAQALNYLKAANLSFALPINFQYPKVEYRRITRTT